MEIRFRLNGKQVQAEVRPDTVLLDLVRELGCYSVKRGCETANCGLCTVWLDGKPVLSCSTLALRADGRHVTTLEGLQKEAEEFGMFLAAEGGEQWRLLQPGLYYERTGHGAGVKGSYRGGDQGVFSRKSLPLQRIYVPASCS